MKQKFIIPEITVSKFDSECVTQDSASVVNSNYDSAKTWLDTKMNDADNILGVISFK